MTDMYDKELHKKTIRYHWDPTTMVMSDLMEGPNIPVFHHTHGKTGVGSFNPELNFILQLIRFFDRVIANTSQTRVLYCGSHPHLVSVVLPYFPTLQVTNCLTAELLDHEQYVGWILIYDYYVNYKDILNASLERRGLTINDDTGTYVTSYRQAMQEAMVNHREAIKQLLTQQQIINKTLNPILGLWRFTLPWDKAEAVSMDGELWPSIWGAANTSYAWLVTSAEHILPAVPSKIYQLQLAHLGEPFGSETRHVGLFRAVLRYYNITLRSRFYQNPVSNDGQPPDYPELDNSWDSWATVYVLKLLNVQDAKDLIRAWHPTGTVSTNMPINDPFM